MSNSTISTMPSEAVFKLMLFNSWSGIQIIIAMFIVHFAIEYLDNYSSKPLRDFFVSKCKMYWPIVLICAFCPFTEIMLMITCCIILMSPFLLLIISFAMDELQISSERIVTNFILLLFYTFQVVLHLKATINNNIEFKMMANDQILFYLFLILLRNFANGCSILISIQFASLIECKLSNNTFQNTQLYSNVFHKAFKDYYWVILPLSAIFKILIGHVMILCLLVIAIPIIIYFLDDDYRSKQNIAENAIYFIAACAIAFQLYFTLNQS